MEKHTQILIQEAINGNTTSMESLLHEVQDLVFNLSLRMLGTKTDAEDATQDILIRIMTNLKSFRMESNFKTWVYRIAVNYLIDYKKSMFAAHPLNFEFYANDIKAGFIENTEELLMGASQEALAEELKISCTNVMLQCLDPETRCIFILGTMFKIDSRMAGEILNMTPENYRQKLSRARRKMATFLKEHCGLTETGCCNCQKRVGYAIKTHRLNPHNMEFQELEILDKNILSTVKESMEEIEELGKTFENMPQYRSTVDAKQFLEQLLHSKQMEQVQNN